jgi:lactobin A/cerein 7B family class IIb bacteriocin
MTILPFNGGFSVRKCAIKRKEKNMVASYGETSGFTPVTNEELETVNGGLSPVLPIVVVAYGIGCIVNEAVKSSGK